MSHTIVDSSCLNVTFWRWEANEKHEACRAQSQLPRISMKTSCNQTDFPPFARNRLGVQPFSRPNAR